MFSLMIHRDLRLLNSENIDTAIRLRTRILISTLKVIIASAGLSIGSWVLEKFNGFFSSLKRPSYCTNRNPKTLHFRIDCGITSTQ